MSAGEVAGLIAALAFAGLVAVISITLIKLHATLASLQAMVVDVHRSTVPLLEELREAVSAVNMEIDRVDGILASAESVAATTSNVTGLVSAAVTNPIVKALAFLAGVGAGARAFKKARRR